MLQLLGKPVAEKVYADIKSELMRSKICPHLAVILVGHDPASEIYVLNKKKKCQDLGFKSTMLRLPDSISEPDLTNQIQMLNKDPQVHGILIQLPLPKHLNANKIINTICPKKDADGLTAVSLGYMLAGDQLVAPCTPSGIIEILNYYKIPIEFKKALVIGRSQLVGQPLFQLLNQKNATVTLAHSKTLNMKSLLKDYDLVFVAIGQNQFFQATDFKKGAVVIDVGIHHNSKVLTGDVNPEGGNGHLQALTPVPGGVGPMTIAMLMKNTLQLAKLAENAQK